MLARTVDKFGWVSAIGVRIVLAQSCLAADALPSMPGRSARPSGRYCIAPGLMETSITREGIIGNMGAPRKYPDELRERATRMALEALSDPDRSHGAIVRVAEQLGVHREALRTWVRKAQAEGQDASSVSADRDARLAQLEKENRELRRANTILKQASAFFAAEVDRPQR